MIFQIELVLNKFFKGALDLLYNLDNPDNI